MRTKSDGRKENNTCFIHKTTYNNTYLQNYTQHNVQTIIIKT